MRVQALGHVVLQVRNLARAEEFYHGVLGLPIAAHYQDKMTFFTLGNHHDFAVMAVGDDAKGPAEDAVGLAHVAFKVGDSVTELKKVAAELAAAGVAVDHATDHKVSQSVYLKDPDGNWVELYVDVSDVWRNDPQAVATIRRITL